MKKEPLPLIYYWIKGAIGKQFVIKQYKYGPVKTKYPDMTNIVASESQRKCRNLFKEAVLWAQGILANPEQLSTWQKRTRRRSKHRIFTQLVRYYMLEVKYKKQLAQQSASRMIRKCFITNHTHSLTATVTNDKSEERKTVQNRDNLVLRHACLFDRKDQLCVAKSMSLKLVER